LREFDGNAEQANLCCAWRLHEEMPVTGSSDSSYAQTVGIHKTFLLSECTQTLLYRKISHAIDAQKVQ
jgi:hypothetical protein